ncbi:TRAP transporter small permease [Candidatus Latescibacterota bacterium]
MTYLFRAVDRTLEALVAAVLAVMTVIVSANVFCRFILSFSLSWGDETAQVCLVWITFLGSALAMRSRSHYAFDYLVKSLPVRAGYVITMVSQVVVIIMTAVLLYWSVETTVEIRQWIMPATGISRAWVYGVCPVGCFFMLIYAVRNLMKDMQMIPTQKL